MKKFIFILIGTLLGLCGQLRAQTHTVDVGQFEKLKINGNISVVYKNLPDSTGLAKFTAGPDAGDIFIFSTKDDGTLKVEPTEDKWGSRELPVLYLYSDFLSNLESYSDRNVYVASMAPCAAFSVTQVGNGTITIDDLKCNNVTASISTGNGSIYLSGNCVKANFRMVGAGLISADRLKAENVKCRILGTGSIGCWAVETLNVTGLGTTKIYYKGDPTIKKTGGGKLFELPEEMDEDAYSRLGTPVNTAIQSPTDEDEEEETERDEDDDEEYQTIVTADD